MRTSLILLAAAASAFAADKDFNGRWDIQVINETRNRAWWLEVNGAGTPKPTGKFVSALRGDMNEITDLSIKNGALRFSFHREAGKTDAKPAHLVYTARLEGDKLSGTHEILGRPNTKLQWIGHRAPVITDKDDGSWKPAKPVELFNGKDLSNWKAMVAGKELGWKVENGIMKNVAGANNLCSVEKFWNFLLHSEFRLGQHTNGGLGLRGRYEIQILEDYGRPPDAHSAAALYSRVAPSVNASKRAGEWQTYDITLIGRQLTVVSNGKKVLDKVEVEGLTAMAHDWNEAVAGPLSIQGDHGPVEIRKLTITPLVKK